MTCSPDSEICDVCGNVEAIGECCCGVSYCSVTCQEAHLDKVHEDDEEVDDV